MQMSRSGSLRGSRELKRQYSMSEVGKIQDGGKEQGHYDRSPGGHDDRMSERGRARGRPLEQLPPDQARTRSLPPDDRHLEGMHIHGRRRGANGQDPMHDGHGTLHPPGSRSRDPSVERRSSDGRRPSPAELDRMRPDHDSHLRPDQDPRMDRGRMHPDGDPRQKDLPPPGRSRSPRGRRGELSPRDVIPPSDQELRRRSPSPARVREQEMREAHMQQQQQQQRDLNADHFHGDRRRESPPDRYADKEMVQKRHRREGVVHPPDGTKDMRDYQDGGRETIAMDRKRDMGEDRRRDGTMDRHREIHEPHDHEQLIRQDSSTSRRSDHSSRSVRERGMPGDQMQKPLGSERERELARTAQQPLQPDVHITAKPPQSPRHERMVVGTSPVSPREEVMDSMRDRRGGASGREEISDLDARSGDSRRMSQTHLDPSSAANRNSKNNRRKMETMLRNDSLSSDPSDCVRPPPPRPHKHKKGKSKQPVQQPSFSSSDDEIRSTPEYTSCDDQDLESESISEKGVGELETHPYPDSHAMQKKGVTLSSRGRSQGRLGQGEGQLGQGHMRNDRNDHRWSEVPIKDSGIDTGLSSSNQTLYEDSTKHPVTWRTADDGKKVIGHMILKKGVADGKGKDSGGILGLKVVGGKVTEGGQLGAFVTKVKKGSIADVVGKLRPGDEVIEWNGRSLQAATFEDVYDIIMESKQEPQVELIVHRNIESDMVHGNHDREHRDREHREHREHREREKVDRQGRGCDEKWILPCLILEIP
ncbi:regulating synaptic membrane exocytosis protein 2-like [Lingula anatina]|uniref:Regulating synaptic membrane exocytosis protein 2-like n=1 Tax=Lingula anatina TaxID=7574 RepID=A0A1S3JSX9_LINAN|nr:regulating synaptic membrane exocytosis protein 2-like [Lingula anatina]|eukprot:XP_013413458.1 regulating synaptic membrane exocytosis protein 2-like [Lingula anatina]